FFLIIFIIEQTWQISKWKLFEPIEGFNKIFIRSAESLTVNDFESNWDEIVDNFDRMNLREELLRGIYAYGFEKPSAIQQRAVLPLTKGHDIIAQAQSGTGKTATFTIGILQQLDFNLLET